MSKEIINPSVSQQIRSMTCKNCPLRRTVPAIKERAIPFIEHIESGCASFGDLDNAYDMETYDWGGEERVNSIGLCAAKIAGQNCDLYTPEENGHGDQTGMIESVRMDEASNIRGLEPTIRGDMRNSGLL